MSSNPYSSRPPCLAAPVPESPVHRANSHRASIYSVSNEEFEISAVGRIEERLRWVICLMMLNLFLTFGMLGFCVYLYKT